MESSPQEYQEPTLEEQETLQEITESAAPVVSGAST